MSNLRRLITYADVGTINTSGTIQLYYKSSANANMAGSTNLGSTTVVNANNSNRVYSLEIRADQLPAGHRYVQPVITIGTTTANIGLLALGGEAAYKPASQFGTANTIDTATVT